MIELLLFDRAQKQIGRLIPGLVTLTEIEDLSGEHRLIFTYPSGADWSEHIREGNFAACQDMDQNWQLYEISEVCDRIDTVEAICDHAYYALSGMEYVNTVCEGSATLALTQVLADTGWEPGTVEIQVVRTLAFEHINPLAAIVKISEHWGGELRFRVAISGTRITNRYVDLLTRRGDVTGKRFEFGRDVKDIDITLDRTGVVTALYGWGQGEGISEDGEDTERLTMADAEWIEGEEAELHPDGLTSPAPADKPLGQLWVGDEAARLAYGRYDLGTGQYRHIFGEYESQAKSPQALLWETWRQLQKRNEPLVNIKATVADLEQAKVVEVRNKEGPKIIYSRSSPAIHPETGAEVAIDTPIYVDFAGGRKGSLMVEGTENLIAEVDSEEYIRTAGDNDYAYWVCYSGLEKSTTYTISFEAEFLEGQSDYITVYPYLATGQALSRIHIPYSSECRMTATFTTDDRYNYNLLIYAGRAGQTAGNRIKFKKTQLEKLSYSTPWHIGGGTRNNLTENQSSIETDLAGITSLSGNISRDTTTAWHGSACLKAAPTSAARGWYVETPNNVNRNTQYTASLWLKGSGYIRVQLYHNPDGAALVTQVVNLTDNWQRVVLTGTTRDEDLPLRIYVRSLPDAVAPFPVWYTDGMQIVQGYDLPWHIGGSTRTNPTKRIVLPEALPDTFAVGIAAKMLHAHNTATRTFWECGGYRCYFDSSDNKLKMTNGVVTAETATVTWGANDYVGVYVGRENGNLFIQAKIAGVTGDKAEVTGDAIASGTALYVASKADGEESINAVVADFVLHTGADIDPIGYLSAVPGGGGE